jgi:hypothetical protein
MGNYERTRWNITEHIKEINSLSDVEAMIHNSNERSTGVDPVDGTKSTDPVYRKISKAARFAHDPAYSNPYWTFAGLMQDIVTDLQIKMEERKMSKPEYQHLKRTSMKNLLEEWVEQIRASLRKTA